MQTHRRRTTDLPLPEKKVNIELNEQVRRLTSAGPPHPIDFTFRVPISRGFDTAGNLFAQQIPSVRCKIVLIKPNRASALTRSVCCAHPVAKTTRSAGSRVPSCMRRPSREKLSIATPALTLICRGVSTFILWMRPLGPCRR